MLDMDEKIFEGVYAKDNMDSAVKGLLANLMKNNTALQPKTKGLNLMKKNCRSRMNVE